MNEPRSIYSPERLASFSDAQLQKALESFQASEAKLHSMPHRVATIAAIQTEIKKRDHARPNL